MAVLTRAVAGATVTLIVGCSGRAPVPTPPQSESTRAALCYREFIVQGRVVDEITGEPLEGVLVRVKLPPRHRQVFGRPVLRLRQTASTPPDLRHLRRT